ncbi:MAG: alpha/beta fold hydrolase [Planctomycetota bacterium]|nr:alpha/beta fold hydrolase [Planctomycetota bacterium]
MKTPTLVALATISIGRIHPLCSEPAPMTTDVSFVAKCDRTEQKYVLVLPASFKPEEAHDVLIALHGHGSDRWQFVKQDRDECRAARDVAARHRMIFVSPDYRAKTSWMGPKAEADVVQIIEDLKKKYRISRVILCGASMGGASSLAFAVLHPKLIDGVASMNGTANFLEYENFQAAISESFGGTKEQLPLEYKKRSAEYWPEKLTMPVGLAVSGKDKSVPPQSVLRLAKVLASISHPRVKLIYRPEMGHSTSYEDAVAVLEFIVRSAEANAEEPADRDP